MCEITNALWIAKAALQARPRSVVTIDDLNFVHADFSPYANEIALIDRALQSMALLEVGLRALLLQPSNEQQDSATGVEVIS